MDITTIHMIPEFLTSAEPLDGDRYVLAELGPDDRLDIYGKHPTYNAHSDSWLFEGSTRKRDEEDCWLPEAQFLQIVTERGIEMDFFDF